MLKPAPNLAILTQQKSDKTEGGIVLPDQFTNTYRVVALSEEGETKPCFKKGDFVIPRQHAGSQVTHEKVDYLFVRFDDILAVVV